jgi:elongation factor P
MIPAGDLKKGTTLRVDGNLFRVMKTTYNKPGRGSAYMQTVLMDIATGKEKTHIFSADDRLDDVFVEGVPVQFLYSDGDALHFMNNQNYEQYESPIALFGEDQYFLKENMELELRIYEGNPIDYVLPTVVDYKVVEAEVAVVGDTAGNVTKRIKTETGLSVQVPIFIKEGETIRVDTRDGSYNGRG